MAFFHASCSSLFIYLFMHVINFSENGSKVVSNLPPPPPPHTGRFTVFGRISYRGHLFNTYTKRDAFCIESGTFNMESTHWFVPPLLWCVRTKWMTPELDDPITCGEIIQSFYHIFLSKCCTFLTNIKYEYNAQ